MAGKISELIEAGTLDGTEDFEIVQSGLTRRTSLFNVVSDLSVMTIKVSLTSAEILALNTTPKTLIPAPGEGRLIQPLFVTLRYNYGGSNYVTNTTLQVRYDGVSGNTCTSAILTNSNNAIGRTAAGFAGTFADPLENVALVVDVPTGNPASGNGTLDVYITFTVITL